MGLALIKKKSGNSAGEDLSEILKSSDEKRHFYLLIIRALLVFIKDFSLDLKEIDSEEFKRKIDGLAEKLLSDERTKKLQSGFEKNKKNIVTYIKKQKEYLKDREDEFKEIIDLLTKAMAVADHDNQVYNEKIYQQSEKLEKLTLLDDIRKIKNELIIQVENIRRTVRKKDLHDSEKLEKLSQKVNSLNVELEKAKEESVKDGLTGIYNRRAFDIYIRKLVERNTVTKAPFSLLLLDIDDFKKINDNFGHQTGDRLLVATARKCKEFIRSDDFLARYGGEEFVVVLPGASLRNAAKKGKIICKEIAKARYALEGSKEDTIISITLSIGASIHKKGDTVETVIERADKALYAAKQSGKNRIISEKEIK
ncbi:MAG: GGDEF domain-containing protein [Thermodesulfobacteriota bacterium]|nr:GGDEF domain-containing protein [Thermodesulfobacteriota bacterium]